MPWPWKRAYLSICSNLSSHGERRQRHEEHSGTDLLAIRTGRSLNDNEAAYQRYKIRPRVLVNVDKVDTSAELFGTHVSFPLGFSPSAMHRLAHPEGEVATSRAAAAHRIAMGLSSYATTSLEDVMAQARGNPYFMQICIVQNREITLQLVRRAEGTYYTQQWKELGSVQHRADEKILSCVSKN